MNRAASGRGVGPLMANRPMPALQPIVIRGVTMDETRSPLASCNLEVFDSTSGLLVERLTSDGSGNYVTSPVGMGRLYQIDAYKAGSPDVMGTTVSTSTGS